MRTWETRLCPKEFILKTSFMEDPSRYKTRSLFRGINCDMTLSFILTTDGLFSYAYLFSVCQNLSKDVFLYH